MDIDVDLWRRRIREETFAQYHYEMARAIAREENITAAVEAYRRAIDIRPDYPEAYFRLAALFEKNGQPEQARQVETAALAVNPHFVAWAWHRFAQEACGEGRYEDTLAALEKAFSLYPGLKADPQLAFAHFNLASDAEREGRCAEACALLQQGLRIAPEDIELWRMLGHTSFTGCLFDESRRGFAAALALHPHDPMTLSTFALTLQLCGETEKAVRFHEHAALSAGRRSPVILRNVLCSAAYTYCALGRLEAAADCVAQASSLDPRDVNVLTHRGIVAFLEGRLAQAEALFQEAMTVLPDYGFAESNMALVLDALGRKDEALEMHRRSVLHLGIRRRLFVMLRPWAADRLKEVYRRLGLEEGA